MALGLGNWNNLEANMKMDRAICRDWADVSQELNEEANITLRKPLYTLNGGRLLAGVWVEMFFVASNYKRQHAC